MKTWIKAIPLVAGLAFLSGALAAPVWADDGRRRGGDRVERADQRGHGKQYGQKRDYKQGYRQRNSYGGKTYGGRGSGHRQYYGNRHRPAPRYGHRYYAPRYGHRHYAPYPAFVFRYYHQSTYVAPAERYPQAQPQVIQAVTSQVAQNDSWPETCLMTREYQTEITVGGERVEGYGEACLQPDGSWYRGPAVAVQ